MSGVSASLSRRTSLDSLRRVRLRAGAVLDEAGLVGSGLPAAAWPDDGDPLAGRLLAPVGLDLPPARELRRLDVLTQALLLAAAAAGVDAALSAASRAECALVLASHEGCLDADQTFQASLAPGATPAPAVFPWTLPSTGLGELALRLGLRGPTLCLGAEHPGSSDPDGSDPGGGEARLALVEAAALLCAGEATAALVAFGGALSRERAAALGRAPRLQLGLVLLVDADPAPGGPALDASALAGARDPWARLRGALEAA